MKLHIGQFGLKIGDNKKILLAFLCSVILTTFSPSPSYGFLCYLYSSCAEKKFRPLAFQNVNPNKKFCRHLLEWNTQRCFTSHCMIIVCTLCRRRMDNEKEIGVGVFNFLRQATGLCFNQPRA
jgi:hypothetical protein